MPSLKHIKRFWIRNDRNVSDFIMTECAIVHSPGNIVVVKHYAFFFSICHAKTTIPSSSQTEYHVVLWLIRCLRVIYRDDMNTQCRPSDRDINWRLHMQGQ